MDLKTAIKTLQTARAYIGLSNWLSDKGDANKAEYCANKAYALFVSIPDKIGSKARAILDI